MSDPGKALVKGLYAWASAGYRLMDKKTERLARKVRAALPSSRKAAS